MVEIVQTGIMTPNKVVSEIVQAFVIMPTYFFHAQLN